MQGVALVAAAICSLIAATPAAGAAQPDAGDEIVPFDSPAPAPPPAAPTSPAPPAAPPAFDAEEPVAHPRPIASLKPPPSTAGGSGSDVALIVGEAALAYLTATFSLSVGVVTTFSAPPVGAGLLLAGPAFTGWVVCGIGSLSDYNDGSCVAAIGGAYVGALTSIPLAYIGYVASDDTGELGKAGGLLVGALFGYVVGSTVGAVIGWNVSRVPKRRADDVALRLDARTTTHLTTPALAWVEPLRHRDTLETSAGARLMVPLVAFRF